MSYSVFLLELLTALTLTGLVTETIKVQLDELGRSYKSNLLAGIVAVVISGALAVGYTVICRITWTPHLVLIAAALVLLSWLCAMPGYDKVVQAISQFNSDGKTDAGDESVKENEEE